MSFFTKSTLAMIVVSGFATTALADPRDTLRHGAYQAGVGGCKSPTGAGAMTFDGKNWSGNGQFCKTQALGGDRYRLTCIGLANGTDTPYTAADFDKIPAANKESVDLKISVTGESGFTIDGTPYEFCGSAK